MKKILTILLAIVSTAFLYTQIIAYNGENNGKVIENIENYYEGSQEENQIGVGYRFNSTAANYTVTASSTVNTWLLPDSDLGADIGKANLRFNHAYLKYTSSTAGSFDTLCISGICQSVFGESFAWTPTTNYGAVANSTSTPLWETSNLFVSGTLYTENLTIANKITKPERWVISGHVTSTSWTGTTTQYLGTAGAGQTWEDVECKTDGTVNVSFYDGTNRMDLVGASTTIGTFKFSTNNSFTESEERWVDFGTPASTPTYITCTSGYKLD